LRGLRAWLATNADATIGDEHAVILPGRLLVLLSAFAVGCDAGAVVDIGDARPAPYHFGPPRLLAELVAGYGNENPTLTADLRELYFNSNHGSETESDVWVARRDGAADPFAAPVVLAGLDTLAYEGNPAISLDGLSLYFGSDREGGAGELDIWRTSRATRTAPWSVPENQAALNSPAKDIPRPPGQDGLVMPLSSQRDVPDGYQLYTATRPSPVAAFGAPAMIPELSDPTHNIADAFLTDDGLTLFYASSPIGAMPDLFVSWRKSTSKPFTVPAPLVDLNTAGDERDPWLSPDGTRLYFVSDRSGTLQIYEAPVTRDPL
jgi:WD40 repeat protein